MSESSSGPDRPVQQVPTSDQQSLFGPSPNPPGENSAADHGDERDKGRGFVERDPEEITLGGMPLGRYLEDRGEEWVLAMRERLRAVDWQSWEARYAGRGRPPYHPAPMAALVIYGVIEKKSSLRELEGLACTDLRCMWLTGGIQPDHSTIGRFVCRHADQLRGEGFLEITGEILEVMPEVDREVAGDGTTLEAFASEMSKLETEAAEKWADEILGEEPTGQSSRSGGGSEGGEASEKKRAQKLAEIIEWRVEERANHGYATEATKFSTTEPEAVWHQHKDETYGFGYIPSLMVNGQRFVVGQALDRTSEQAVVDQLLDQAETLLEGTAPEEAEVPAIERVIFDNNYFTLGILEEVYERRLDALIYPDAFEAEASGEELPRRGGKFAKEAFSYKPERDVMVCPNGEELEPFRSGTDRLGRRHRSYGRSEACQECPLRQECTEAKNGRTVKRYEADDLKDTMREVMSQRRAREAYSRRMATVEPVFEEFDRRGFRRCRRRGVDGAATELALHALGHNFDRLRTYLETGRLEVTNLGTETGSYRVQPGETGPGTGAFFGLDTAQNSSARVRGRFPVSIAVRPASGEMGVPARNRLSRTGPMAFEPNAQTCVANYGVTTPY